MGQNEKVQHTLTHASPPPPLLIGEGRSLGGKTLSRWERVAPRLAVTGEASRVEMNEI